MSTHRKHLNPNQVQLLKLLYKFRFVSSDLLAKYRDVTRTGINHSLTILVDQILVDRRYDKSYKIQGKSAVYCLTPVGLRMLMDYMPLNDNVVHAMYKNKTVSEGFIDECLRVVEVCTALNSLYPDTFSIFTRSELAQFDYFPEPKPFLYLSRKKPLKGKQNDYMLDIIADNRKFIIKKRIQTYINHHDSGNWGDEEYPTILLLCATPRIEENALKFTESLLEDFDFYTSTIKRFLESDNRDSAIWSDAVEMDELVSF
ncbi:MAG TPA: hypothetical protein VIH90_04545 [Candidatus Saccharimonadales bacterium]